MLFLSSSTPLFSGSMEPGDSVPAIRLSDKSTLPSKTDFPTIINFWSAQDAASRLRNKEYSDLAAASGGRLNFVAICVDADSGLAREIMAIDGIDNGKAYYSEDIRKDALADYQTASGCRSFLIDNYGRLQAVNPDKSTLHLI